MQCSKGSGVHNHSNRIMCSLASTPEQGNDEDIEPLLQDSSIWELSSCEEPLEASEHWAINSAEKIHEAFSLKPHGWNHHMETFHGAGTRECCIALSGLSWNVHLHPSVFSLTILCLFHHSFPFHYTIRTKWIWKYTFLQIICNSQSCTGSTFWNSESVVKWWLSFNNVSAGDHVLFKGAGLCTTCLWQI